MKSLLAAVILIIPSITYGMSKKEINCMAYAVYHEARGETNKGKNLVIDVIYNRSKSKKYPKNICSIIKQKAQFSFWTGKYVKVTNPKVYIEILRMVKNKSWVGSSKGAMWYHSIRVNPKWRKELIKIATVGNHTFYKQRFS